jgi:hypothetical protein
LYAFTLVVVFITPNTSPYLPEIIITNFSLIRHSNRPQTIMSNSVL